MIIMAPIIMAPIIMAPIIMAMSITPTQMPTTTPIHTIRTMPMIQIMASMIMPNMMHSVLRHGALYCRPLATRKCFRICSRLW